jgi:hypothetical protein
MKQPVEDRILELLDELETALKTPVTAGGSESDIADVLDLYGFLAEVLKAYDSVEAHVAKYGH